MPDIHPQLGDHVEYAPIHKVDDPETAKTHSTGRIVKVNDRPTDENPDHKTYTIENDNTGKQTTYGARNIIKILQE